MSKVKKKKTDEFGKRLTRLIKEHSLVLRELSIRIDVPVSTLQNWKNGVLPTDFAGVKRLARELDVSMAYLLTGEDDTLEITRPSLEDVFADGGSVFDGYLEVKIKRLIPKSKVIKD